MGFCFCSDLLFIGDRDYRANQRSRTLLKKERVHIETQDTVVLYDRLPKNLD